MAYVARENSEPLASAAHNGPAAESVRRVKAGHRNGAIAVVSTS